MWYNVLLLHCKNGFILISTLQCLRVIRFNQINRVSGWCSTILAHLFIEFISTQSTTQHPKHTKRSNFTSYNAALAHWLPPRTCLIAIEVLYFFDSLGRTIIQNPHRNWKNIKNMKSNNFKNKDKKFILKPIFPKKNQTLHIKQQNKITKHTKHQANMKTPTNCKTKTKIQRRMKLK